MKTQKCKVAVFDCKTKKMKIEEREMPVYDPPKPTPSPLETVLYHLCKVLNVDDDAVNEFVKHYENTFGVKYTPSESLIVEKTQKVTYKEQIDWNGGQIVKKINVPVGIVKITLSGTISPAIIPGGTAPPQSKVAVLDIKVGDDTFSYSSPVGSSKKLNSVIATLSTKEEIEITMKLGGQYSCTGCTPKTTPAEFNVELDVYTIPV